MENSQRTNRNSGAYVGAVLLIVIGAAALIANLGGSDYVYRGLPLAAGLAFLVAYGLTRRYGFLVPGGILTGAGSGLMAAYIAGAGDAGPYTVIGGGLGFLLIFTIDVLVSRDTTRWWPVVPGGLMVLAGAVGDNNKQAVIRDFEVWSSLLLIGLGLLILFTRLRRPAR